MKEIEFHNEFTIIGRVINKEDALVGKDSYVMTTLLCPNDMDYNTEPNKVNVYIPGHVFDNIKITNKLGIIGHIEFNNNSNILIADSVAFIK